MKKFVLMAVASLTVTLSAQAECLYGEAQVAGLVEEVQVTPYGCQVFLTPTYKIQHHALCPLDEGILMNQGINMGFIGEGQCGVKAGDKVSRILIDKDGVITAD